MFWYEGSIQCYRCGLPFEGTAAERSSAQSLFKIEKHVRAIKGILIFWLVIGLIVAFLSLGLTKLLFR